MSGIEEILGLLGASGGGAGAGAGTGTATGALTGTSMLAPFTEGTLGGLTPGTGMMAGPESSAAGSAGSAKAGKGLLGSGGASKSGGSGQMAMDLLKMMASRPQPNTPAAMYAPPGARGSGGQPTAMQIMQMLRQRGGPQLRGLA